MKKAKVMFTALAVLAVVGGALAFKAKNVSNQKLYYWDTQAVSVCTFTAFATSENQGNGEITPPTDLQDGYFTIQDCSGQKVTAYQIND